MVVSPRASKKRKSPSPIQQSPSPSRQYLKGKSPAQTSPDRIDTNVTDFITNALKKAQNIQSPVEIEMRFRDPGLESGISYEAYNDLLRLAGQQIQQHQDIVEIKKFGNNTVRKISSNTGIEFQEKNRINLAPNQLDSIKYLQNNYKIKAEISHERSVNFSDHQFRTSGTDYIFRRRKRMSFTDTSKNWRIDLTQIEETTDTSFQSFKKRYEAEIEYLGRNVKSPIKNILIIRKILLIVQRSSVLSTFKQSQDARHEISRMTNTRPDNFPGPLPLTLMQSNVDNILCNYSVTDKADGERNIMYINRLGHVYLFGRSPFWPMRFPSVNPKYGNSIIDVEVVNNKIYAFDLLFRKGKDFRNVKDLRIRYAALRVLAKNLRINVKKFYFTNIFKNAEKIWKHKASLPYELDGLIFTPIDQTYDIRIGNPKTIYKWKPHNTIDFHVVKYQDQRAGPVVWLRLQESMGADKLHQKFSGANNDGMFRHLKRGQIGLTRNEIFFDESIHQDMRHGIFPMNPQWEKYESNTVVECAFKNGKFVPMKTRDDKQYGNAVRASNDAWDAIKNPVTENEIFDKQQICYRKFHNKIKTELINYYARGKAVLDIGPGAGGDIQKYTKVNTTHVTGIDITPVKYNYPANKMKFYTISNNIYNINKLIKNNKVKKFDVVNCQFAGHYFFKDEAKLNNFVENIKKVLKPGGVLVMTLMDGNILLQKFNKGKLNGNLFSIKLDLRRKNKLTGRSMNVTLKGTKYFQGNRATSKEFLVNIDSFIDFMKPNGFSVNLRKPFKDYCAQFPETCNILTKAEKEFSFLNTVLVFKLN